MKEEDYSIKGMFKKKIRERLSKVEDKSVPPTSEKLNQKPVSIKKKKRKVMITDKELLRWVEESTKYGVRGLLYWALGERELRERAYREIEKNREKGGILK